MNYKTTSEVCALLGMTPAGLNSWLSRHERYKPKRRGADGFLWTDAEIAAVQAARATRPPNATSRNTTRRNRGKR